jgi:imidazolonepropionase-like amidohydrolase
MKILTTLLAGALLLGACSNPKKTEGPASTAFTNVTLIDGTGSAPITNAVLLIQNGRVKAVGSKETVTLPENATIVDLQGKYIIPGLINAHGHVGEVKGIEPGHYSKENVIDNLAIYA